MTSTRERLEAAIKLYTDGKLGESEAILHELHGEPVTRHDASYGLGLIALKQRAWDRAYHWFSMISPESHRYVAARYGLAQIEHQRGNRIAALRFADECLARDPGHAGARTLADTVRAASAPSAVPPAYAPATPDSEPDGSEPQTYGGIYALVSADPSPAARATKAAIDALNRTAEPRVSAFIGTAFPRISTRFIVGIGTTVVFALFGGFIVLNLIGIDIRGAGFTPPARYFSGIARVLTYGPFIVSALLAVVFAVLARICWRALEATSTKYVFSQGRIHVSGGVLYRSELLIELFRIDTLTVEQTLMNRLTGDGLLIIESKESPPVILFGLATIDELGKIRDQLRDVRDRLRAGPWMRMGVIN